MKHRIFIAINLPENIKKDLSDSQFKWLELPCRWTKKENLHITLAFLGYLQDDELLEVLKITKEVSLRHQPFIINFNKILYGPPGKPSRMVWVEGEENEELGKLQGDLENSLNGLQVDSGKAHKRGYAPHITLGRLKQWEFQAIEPEERPDVNEDINLNFEVNSVEAMESNLKRNGPEYAILESFPFSV